MIAAAAIALAPAIARGQYQGSNIKGDYGLQSGTQAPPGAYFGIAYLRYDTDSVRNRNGDQINPGTGNVDVSGFAPLVTWVSSRRFLGAHVGMAAVPAWMENALVAPALGLASDTGLGWGDSYLQPVNLGWHLARADVITGFGMFMPTGSHAPDGSHNRGLGMWSYEVSGGTTVFFDEAKSWHAATLASFEMHSKKKDSDVKVGNLLTLEGGVGRAFLQGAMNVGAAYFAQWKVSDDQFQHAVLDPLIARHRVFAIGPEVTLPIAAQQKLIALVTARYLWENGAHTTTQGNMFMLMATFPLMRPSTQ
jgi:hypothetical protein